MIISHAITRQIMSKNTINDLSGISPGNDS